MTNNTKRIEAALEYKHNGYNCAQSIILAHTDLLNVDKELLLNVSSGFGAGMGCMEATCGALCGTVMIAGILKNGNKTPTTSKLILNKFKEKCGATICKELKGINTGKILCSCDDCIKNAIIALDEILTTIIK